MERDEAYIKPVTVAVTAAIGIFKIFPLVKGFMPNGGSGMWLMASVLCFVAYFFLYPLVKFLSAVLIGFIGLFRKQPPRL
ncbi:hypothetical protein [Seleniivibrio woodruffii]|uniref:Uncharacterized protein n=1 Tax=Seleniivibrio woodruffii TaxID=1078050 RepID=A0A4R1KDF7_9BACT|nr:hypothetical protein [Seleniivibrio woodruffii]TCK62636.1 hypothetical protein C8D98_1169 [Seleniivibrio woodruffii]TVZ36938.1 hypothetical protein OF66_2580 [Seleniivibrio woodruffii]